MITRLLLIAAPGFVIWSALTSIAAQAPKAATPAAAIIASLDDLAGTLAWTPSVTPAGQAASGIFYEGGVQMARLGQR